MKFPCHRPGLLAAALLCVATSRIQHANGQSEGPKPWINEFHYDNFADDVGEFIEVAVPDALVDDVFLRTFEVFLYNGFYGRLYLDDFQHNLQTFTKGASRNGVTFYSKSFRPANCTQGSEWCGLQNGKDGFALVEFFSETSGKVLELLSYEGTFTCKDGPAAEMATTDVGVFQKSTTPKGWTIAKQGIGCVSNDFSWRESPNSHDGTTGATLGDQNREQSITCRSAFINEFHYDDVQGGQDQFVEVAFRAGAVDASDFSIVLYNGEDGLPYDTIPLSSFSQGDTTSSDGLTFYSYQFPTSGGDGEVGLITSDSSLSGGLGANTTMAGIALSDDKSGTVVDFISYGGSFEALGGVAEGMTSVYTGADESEDTPLGSSVQLTTSTDGGCSAMDFVWTVVESNQLDFAEVGETRGKVNQGQDVVCLLKPPTIAQLEAEAAANEPALADDDDDFLDPDSTIDYTTTVSRTYNFAKGPDGKVVPADDGTI